MISVPVPRDDERAGVVTLLEEKATGEDAGGPKPTVKLCGGLKYDIGDFEDNVALDDCGALGIIVV